MPTEPLRELALEWIKQRKYETDEGINVLTERTAVVNRGKGLSNDMVRIVVNGTRPQVSFRTADIMLCAAGVGAAGWLRPELAPYYIPLKTCEGCGEVLEYAYRGTHRKACSPACKERVRRRREPESVHKSSMGYRRRNRAKYNAYMRDWRARKKLVTA